MEFDKEYFFRYAGSDEDYAKVYREFSSIDNCIDMFLQEDAPNLKRICVLGTATGKVLDLVHKKLGLLAYGCEISPWALSQIKKKFKNRIKLEDMRKYILDCPNVDLIFSNSLMYLDESDILPLLKKAQTKCRYFHFEGSYWGAACPDPYRKTLKTRRWWKNIFIQAGFKELTTIWGKHTYLWESSFIKNSI